MFFKDVFDDNGKWSHLRMEIENANKPNIYLRTGGQKRFKLVNDNHTIFWGNISTDTYDMWILKSLYEWKIEEMPILPITSEEIEKLKDLKYEFKIPNWAKYFANSLNSTSNTFLYNGIWEINLANSKDKKRGRPFTNWYVKEIDEVFSKPRIEWSSWGVGGNLNLISLKMNPDANSGRVKWWRKKIKEESCPPILVWYIDCLLAYIIIDGHCRLKAYQLENKEPKILVINSVYESENIIDMDKQRGILELVRQNENLNMPQEKINQLLIDAFDNRPEIISITKGFAKKKFEIDWVKEVQEFRNVKGIDQEHLEAMIKG